MAITVEAIYENGVLKPSEPLPWKNGERVRVAISSLDSPILKWMHSASPFEKRP